MTTTFDTAIRASVRRGLCWKRAPLPATPFCRLRLLASLSVFAVAPAVQASPPSKSRAPRTISELVERAGDWVVALRVEREKDLESRVRIPGRLLRGDVRDYYRRPEGYVSGLLLDREGHILTSYYNVGGELKSIRVVLPGGRERTARLVARDPTDDLALVRVEANGEELLESAWKGPSWAKAPPRAGQILLAVGRSPDPRHLTVTEGIVSAGGRNSDRTIQTDAKLNYGNVGGPLLDLSGRVVALAGFVGHIHPQWGYNSGIGFGTRAAVILDVLPRLQQGDDIEPPELPFLGVVSNRDALRENGAVVERVIEGSAADRAGLLGGDVIIEFAGRSLKTFNELRQMIAASSAGQVVVVKVRRGKAVLDLEVKLGRRRRRG